MTKTLNPRINRSYVDAATRFCDEVAAVHGEPRIKVLEPQLRLLRVCAVWFLPDEVPGRSLLNCGFHIDGIPDSEGSGHFVSMRGPGGSVEFSPSADPVGGRMVTTGHLRELARMVGLLP